MSALTADGDPASDWEARNNAYLSAGLTWLRR